jgi:adenosine deaminase
LQFPARIPASPQQVSESIYSWLQQLVTVYQLAGSRAKPGGGNFLSQFKYLLYTVGMMRLPSFFAASVFACLLAATTLFAQPSTPEANAARAYQAALAQGPLALRGFLTGLPKGADLHVHLSGAVYAESFIREAGQDGLCVDPVALSFADAPCTAPLVSAIDLSGSITSSNQRLYDRLIDSFSMRGFVPTSGFSGHDQFFATFGRFGWTSKTHSGEWIDEVASRAAAQNQQYTELMLTPTFTNATTLSKAIAKNFAGPIPTPQEFAAMRQTLLGLGLSKEVSIDSSEVSAMEQQRLQIEQCGTPQAAPACSVETRYIYQILRGSPPEKVFAQTLLGFETIQASIDAHLPGFVGINFVQPEDGLISMRDYTLQMYMLDYLHTVYPKVPISLHAGELTLGLVPPEGLRFHVRQAVELGHAQRIGHGVDVMYEDDAPALLNELAQQHVMIEVNLSSNEGILGVKGIQHPFPLYLAAHVPVALATDDEGVSRIDLTNEYVRAALDYHLSYQDLKQLARTGMEHSFLQGPSLWAARDDFTNPVPSCRGAALGIFPPPAACKAFLDDNEKAAAQWELERRFREYEAKF